VAVAQNISAQDGDEIIVTAQKRSESIQSVPLSITAIGSKDLTDRRIVTLADISAISPGVAFINQGGGRAQLVMRGLATAPVPTDKPTLSEAVGIFFDDIPVAMALRNPDLQPVDLQRIEVLRGPQGTLYGGGALGGAIKLVGNTPNYSELEFGGSIEASSTMHGGFGHNVSAYFNAPITGDAIAVRAVAYHRFMPGFVKNIVTGENHSGDVETTGGRLQVGLKVGERFEAIAKVIYQKMEIGPGYERVSRDVPNIPGGSELHGLQRATFLDEKNSDTMRLYNWTMNYDLDTVQLYSSTSYINRNANSLTDFTAFTVTDAPNVISAFRELVPVKQFIQEIRASSSGAGPFKWTIGAFYSDTKRHYDNWIDAPGYSAATGIDTASFGSPFDFVYDASNSIRDKQIALFGEGSYEITPQITFTAGLRGFKQKQRFDIAVSGLYNGGQSSAAIRSKDDGLNPRFILAYKPSGTVMISAQAAKGFRLGGGNDNVPTDLCRGDLDALGIQAPSNSFKSERVWNYEINAKTSLAGGRVTFNPSIFRIDYSNIQIVQSLPSCLFNFVTNAGTARSQGVEFDLSVRLTDGLTIRGGGAYTDAKLTSTPPPGVVGVKGGRLPLSPRLSGNIQLRYTHEVSPDWSGFGQVDVRYIGDINSQLYDPNNVLTSAPNLRSYTLAGLRIGGRRDSTEIALFVDNIFNEMAFTSATAPGAEGTIFGVTRPRVIGIALTVNGR
jgi:iron complex outermembrane receptor protein